MSFDSLPAHPAGMGMPARSPGQVADPPDHWRSLLATADRACCCTAPPAVVVIVPPAPDRPKGTDLLLCRHHFRASRQQLDAIGAVGIDPDDVPEDPDFPGKS